MNKVLKTPKGETKVTRPTIGKSAVWEIPSDSTHVQNFIKNELLHNLGKPAKSITPHGEAIGEVTLVKEYKLTLTLPVGTDTISFYDYGEGYKMEVMEQFHNRDKVNRVEARRRWNALIADGWKVVNYNTKIKKKSF